MKREAPTNSKMKRLCRLLDVPLYQAVGILELLWHLTARETPRGDIGKISNEDIATFLEYRDDEDKLIEALVRTGWLDEDPVYRLIVHDWHEHADQAVGRRLDRSSQKFIQADPNTKQKRRKSRLVVTSQNELLTSHVQSKRQNVQTNGEITSSACAREPEPEPEPDTHAPLVRRKDTRAGARKTLSPEGDVCVSLLRMWNDYCEPEFKRVEDTRTRRDLLRTCIKRYHVTPAMMFEAVQNLKSGGGRALGIPRANFDWLVQFDNIVKTLDGVFGKAMPDLRNLTLGEGKPQ